MFKTMMTTAFTTVCLSASAYGMYDSSVLSCSGKIYNGSNIIEYSASLSELNPDLVGYKDVAVKVTERVYNASGEVWSARTIASDSEATLFQNSEVVRVDFNKGVITMIEDAQPMDKEFVKAVMKIESSFRNVTMQCR